MFRILFVFKLNKTIAARIINYTLTENVLAKVFAFFA